MSVSSHQGQFYSNEAAENNPQDTMVEVRDRRRHNFFVIDNEVIDDYGPILKSWGLAVYMCLARHANQDHQAWPSQNTIAKEIGLSRGKVRDGIALLEETGLIKTKTRWNEDGSLSSTLYTLLPVPKKRGRLNSQPPGNGEEGGRLNSQGVGRIAKGRLNSPKQDTPNKTQSGCGDTPTEANASSTASAYGSGGNRDQDNVQSHGELNSTPPRSRETQYPNGAARPVEAEVEAEALAERALAAFESCLDHLDLAPLKERERKQFRNRWVRLFQEDRIDKETARAIARRTLERWPRKHLSPDYAYDDVLKDPDKYPPMTNAEFIEWIDDYEVGDDEYDDYDEEETRWEVVARWDGLPEVYRDFSRHVRGVPHDAPEWVKRQYAEMMAEHKANKERKERELEDAQRIRERYGRDYEYSHEEHFGE